MKVNGLISCKGENCYIVPAMLPYAKESDLSTALKPTHIQTSTTICLKSRYIPITRPVFHVVLAKCIQRYTIANSSLLHGLDSQSVSERKTCSKNYGYFTTKRPTKQPWHFIVAYQLGHIRVTLFKKRKEVEEKNCPAKGKGVELLRFVENSLKTAIDRYQHKDDSIMKFVDTNIFHGVSEPIEINDDLANELESNCSDLDFTIEDMLVWFPNKKVIHSIATINRILLSKLTALDIPKFRNSLLPMTKYMLTRAPKWMTHHCISPCVIIIEEYFILTNLIPLVTPI